MFVDVVVFVLVCWLTFTSCQCARELAVEVRRGPSCTCGSGLEEEEGEEEEVKEAVDDGS